MALAKYLLAIIMVSDSMGALSDMLNRHQNTRVTSLEIVFFCVLAVLLSLTLYSSPIAKLLPTHDQSMFVYFGNAIDAGKIPYVDMFDHKGPILWLINALGWLRLGPVRVLWLIEIAVITISCIYMFKLSLYFANRATSLVATLVGLLMLMRFSIGGNISEEYALPCIAMTLYLMLSYLTGEEARVWPFVIFGLTGTAVFFIRPNMVGLWVVSVITVIVVEVGKRRWSRLLRLAMATLIGALIIIVPLLLYGLLTHSLAEMIYGTITFNLRYVAAENKVSILKMLIFVAGTFFMYGAIIPQIYLIVKAVRHPRQRLIWWFLVAVGIVNAMTVIVSRRMYSHYLITQIPIAVIGLAVLIRDANAWLSTKRHWQQNMMTALMIWLVIGGLGPILGIGEFAHKSIQLSRTRPISNQERLIAAYIRKHTSSKDTIYAWRYDANIYNLSGRFANNPYFTLPSIHLANYPTIEHRLVMAFTSDQPAYFIAKRSLFVKPAQSDAEKQIRKIIQSDYQAINIRGTDGTFKVFRLK